MDNWFALETFSIYQIFTKFLCLDNFKHYFDSLELLPTMYISILCLLGHTGRLLKSLCFISLSFLLLHIIFQITINSLEAGNNIEPGFNCEYPFYLWCINLKDARMLCWYKREECWWLDFFLPLRLCPTLLTFGMLQGLSFPYGPKGGGRFYY